MLVPNPKFETKEGHVLSLKPIPVGVYKRFLQEWLSRNPAPKPPKKPVTIIDTVYLEDDLDNQWYLIEFNLWSLKKDRAELDFILSRGILGDPPENWLPDVDTVSANPSSNELKALWLMECIFTEEDLDDLKEAIVSLSTPTQKAVEESEKN